MSEKGTHAILVDRGEYGCAPRMFQILMFSVSSGFAKLWLIKSEEFKCLFGSVQRSWGSQFRDTAGHRA